MKNKSEVPHLFSIFKAQIENLLSTTLKTLRTDGGTEYIPITKQFSQIIHQTTFPYTPQQNGFAERKHRHIIELTLAVMSHASLSSHFWDEICSSVVYLINRLPSPSHSAKIPYTELFYKNPDYSFLKILGCLCFPYTRPYNSHKLENCALPCLFLGYATTQKGFRCLHLLTNRLYISRHIQFDEACFPFKNLSTVTQQPLPSDDHNSLFHFLTEPAATPFQFQPSAQPSTVHGPISSSTAPPTFGPAPLNSLLPTTQTTHGLAPLQPAFPFHLTPPDPTQRSTEPLQPNIAPPQPTFTSPINQPSTSTYSPWPPLFPSESKPVTTSSPPDQPSTVTSTHPMITRTRDNTRRPRIFHDHVAFSATLETEPPSFTQANTKPKAQHYVS